MLDERFCRMWEFYLILSEFSFRYGKHVVFQMQLARQVETLPLTRDYMLRAERDLLEREGQTQATA
jgi:cyclopropane-fatty-acyl-phospholipid synthase